MNKAAIKNYAVSARRKLVDVFGQRMTLLGVAAGQILTWDDARKTLEARGIFLSGDQKAARDKIVDGVKADGWRNYVEEVAYTWFNRLIALRFMEVNGYLPSGVRVLSSENPGRLEPDCVREYERLDYIDRAKADELRAKGSDALYRYILIRQLDALRQIMPRMFTKLSAECELLLPDRLYTQEGIVYDLVHGVGESDFGEQVEIIGWLYQYYISEKKDEVFAGLKKNVKVTKENIPAATQLFTPDWIVKYMVENSLGRIFIANSGIRAAASEKERIEREKTIAGQMGWKYYIPEAEQTPEVRAQLATAPSPLTAGHSPLPTKFNIEDIKLIDPCMGSGHILAYAFDVLFQIYQSAGYAERDIPGLILEKNIYGLDIDERACQLSYFALMMKARGRSRRFFRDGEAKQAWVFAVDETNYIPYEHIEQLGSADVKKIHAAFKDAREYGSLIRIDGGVDVEAAWKAVSEQWSVHSQTPAPSGDTPFINSMGEMLGIVNTARLLAREYDVVVTNPPYMGGGNMGAQLSEFVKKHYPDGKNDLFAAFIERCGAFTKANGYQAMITQHTWMFLSGYERLRLKTLNRDMVNMAHLGSRAFEEISGEVVTTTAFVMRNANLAEYVSTFVRLVGYPSQQGKEIAYLAGNDHYLAAKTSFAAIPGAPVAYWANRRILEAFRSNSTFGGAVKFCVGISTADNGRFLRYWHEIDAKDFAHPADSFDKVQREKKWFPFNNGGETRRWYGNNYLVVNWENDGFEIKATGRASVRNKSYYYRSGYTWTDISTGNISLRRFDYGFIFSTAGLCMFGEENLDFAAAFLNSKASKPLLEILCPSLHFNIGDLAKIPMLPYADKKEIIERLSRSSVQIARTDWDAFETSWDFKRHPLIPRPLPQEGGTALAREGGTASAQEGETASARDDGSAPARAAAPPREGEPAPTRDGSAPARAAAPPREGHCGLAAAFAAWEEECEARFQALKSNEEALNRIFIDIYGLRDELTPEVEDKDVTVRRADPGREIRSLISYAVGCVFGRYSLDADTIHCSLTTNHCGANAGAVIPITDADYFDDDMTLRFAEFIETVYGADTLSENLEYIAGVLYPNAGGTAREKIRRYFLNDFYKDHLKIYQKRPVYWLFDSGRENGFKALIYLHRYDKHIAARVRTDYLHPLQRKYDAEIGRLTMLSGLPETPAREIAENRKRIESIRKKIDECRVYDQIIAYVANQNIELDLDDGVKANYAKFQGVDVPRGDGRGSVKMNLLAPIKDSLNNKMR
ncbi:MAG: BREX-1 system adenine-specific DNA-methyltransferase PglX [Peptococcaceae bacterium]|jgi:hypothetical protein|nr:BREX-1 system adenine-specific DNA-methyltransferase PglX [Peptococcaceae bacterium]